MNRFKAIFASITILVLILGRPIGAAADNAVRREFASSGQGEAYYREITVNATGEHRRYLLYTPALYRHDSSAPLVLVFHGSFGNGHTTMTYTQMNSLADKKGFLVAYPEKAGWYDWDFNWGHRSREVDYIQAVLQDIQGIRSVDANRIYAAGYSSGGDLVNILACSLSDRFAAIAPIGTNMNRMLARQCVGKPVPIMLVNGTDDPIVNWRGNAREFSIPDTFAFWRQRNACKPQVEDRPLTGKASDGDGDDQTDATLHRYKLCRANAEVDFVEVKNGGHTWPGAPTNPLIRLFMGRTSHKIEANSLIWSFFSRHTLAERFQPEPRPSDRSKAALSGE